MPHQPGGAGIRESQRYAAKVRLQADPSSSRVKWSTGTAAYSRCQLGSLFVTRPMLWDYVATRNELERRASDLFAWISAGALDVHIGARFPAAEAADAHRALESRETTGKILLDVRRA